MFAVLPANATPTQAYGESPFLKEKVERVPWNTLHPLRELNRTGVSSL